MILLWNSFDTGSPGLEFWKVGAVAHCSYSIANGDLVVNHFCCLNVGNFITKKENLARYGKNLSAR